MPGPPHRTGNSNNNPANQSTSVSSNSVSSTKSQTTRPGAYQVTRSSAGPAQVYRVTIPEGVRPGTDFSVHAGSRRVRVKCPNTSRPGQSLQITIPGESITNYNFIRPAPLTAELTPGGGAVTMSEDVKRVNETARQSGGTAKTYLVTIPPNIYPGMEFIVNVNSQRFKVSCPPTAGPNMKVRIVPPVQADVPEAAPKTQVFEVAVPPGVKPGEPFALVANGQPVLVTCPPNVNAGQKVRFQLPVSQVVGNISLSYESQQGGWKRTIRVTDLKFQWVRIDDGIDLGKDFDFMKSAFLRKLCFLEGNDARMRTGTLEVVKASEGFVESKIVWQNKTIVSYADIAAVQNKELSEKKVWFENICSQLTSPWEEGHIKICVRRSQLLTDAVDAVMGLGRDDMRKRWRIEFLGEPALDFGGPTKEFFELITEQVFDPACGLWVPSINNQACVDINPSCDMSCPDDYLIYYRFVGRIMGRALFDNQVIKGHMVRMIYKHLLGWPITFEDVKAHDDAYYQSLKKLTEMDDLSVMCLDFTVTEESMGVRIEKELVEGGAMMEVTKDNLSDYLEANIRYRMFNRTKAQLTELLLGFFDVVPEPALTVFDANELELVLCGLPTIDLENWKANTNYCGTFEFKGKSHRVVNWFWETVEEFDQEMRARLLQFSTGTSGVPLRGFEFLQGIDGNIKKFTIQGVDGVGGFPKSHTCFNRIDLPEYNSKKDLQEKLRVAITTSCVGFDIE